MTPNENVSPLEQSVFVQLFLPQMTEIQGVVLLLPAGNTVKLLSVESKLFCKGGSIILGRIEVGVPHMQSFWDSKVIKTNFNCRSTLFL